MIEDQAAIKALPGAYEIAVCDEHGEPLSDWVWTAPRTLFDESTKTKTRIVKEGFAWGVLGRSGEKRAMFRYKLWVTEGCDVNITAGSEGTVL